MLAASAFSLLIPAGQEALQRGPMSLLGVAVALVVGALFISSVGKLISKSAPTSSLAAVDELAARSTFENVEEASRVRSRGILFVIAMMLHNFPEGLASGAALGGLSATSGMGMAHGWSLLGAIAIQNLPEGLATLLAFRALGLSQKTAFLGAFASALVELVGGVLGGVLLQMTHGILPMLLSFAGGAMLYVSIREVRERIGHRAANMARLKSFRDLALGTIAMAVMTLLLNGIFNP